MSRMNGVEDERPSRDGRGAKLPRSGDQVPTPALASDGVALLRAPAGRRAVKWIVMSVVGLFGSPRTMLCSWQVELGFVLRSLGISTQRKEKIVTRDLKSLSRVVDEKADPPALSA
jgi:hypothetical protein